MPEEVPLYDDFSSAYDLMVDWPRRLANEAPFFEDLVRRLRARRVIDLGCGTGHHARMFASWGLSVVAVDASAGMIEEARRAAPPDAGDIEWVRADFLGVSSAVEGPFDIAVCLGNSLPHLASIGEVQQALEGFASLTRPGGALVVQLRNADRLYGGGKRVLGPSRGVSGGVERLFVRVYHPEPDHLDLTIVTLSNEKGTWRAQADSTRLVPLHPAELIDMLTRADYEDVESFADYRGTPFDPSSDDDLVLTAIRA